MAGVLEQKISDSVHNRGLDCSLQRDPEGRVFWMVSGQRYSPIEAVRNFVDEDWSVVYHDID